MILLCILTVPSEIYLKIIKKKLPNPSTLFWLMDAALLISRAIVHRKSVNFGHRRENIYPKFNKQT